MKTTRTGAALFLALACIVLQVHAVAQTPTKQAPQASNELLSQHDAELIKEVIRYHIPSEEVMSQLALDKDFIQALRPILKEFREHLKRQLPLWIAEEREVAGNAYLMGRDLERSIFLRTLNEQALAWVESAGPEYDEAWAQALLAPRSCLTRSDGHPANHRYGPRLSRLNAAPAKVRDTLLRYERELLLRWGTVRKDLPARPSPQLMLAAEHAVTRMKANLPVDAQPMTPYLAAQLFKLDRPKGLLDDREACALHQWWLRSRLAANPASRQEALNVHRYATLFDLAQWVPSKPSGGQGEAGPKLGEYPAAASYFHVEGIISVLAILDANAKPLRAQVDKRALRVPGVRHNRPVAFETLLDQASIAYAMQRPYAKGSLAQVTFDIDWNLKDGSNDEH